MGTSETGSEFGNSLRRDLRRNERVALMGFDSMDVTSLFLFFGEIR
jgi:hypothetical protein